jgi:membrane-bound lytic murein transglycosylase B
MKMFKWIHAASIIMKEKTSFGVVMFVGFCLAPLPAAAVEIDNYPALVQLIDKMHRQHGLSKTTLRTWFSQARIVPEIIEAISRPKEDLPWYEYKKLFVTEERVARGVEYWKDHADTLHRAHRDYGVDPEVIVAIIGIETRYGKNTGRHSVLNALTTLALEYPRRSEFFRKELEQYLLLVRELNIDPLKIKGSYAGAMGVAQFMPSSYRHYAVDFDNDGKRDLLGNTEDAIGSVANYLKQHGWQPGETITRDLSLEDWLHVLIRSLQPAMTTESPVKPALAVVVAPEAAPVITLEGEDGPIYRFGYTNFNVIMRYNLSKRYAMAAFELSQRLRKRYDEAP